MSGEIRTQSTTESKDFEQAINDQACRVEVVKSFLQTIIEQDWLFQSDLDYQTEFSVKAAIRELGVIQGDLSQVAVDAFKHLKGAHNE